MATVAKKIVKSTDKPGLQLTIQPPNFGNIELTLVGTAPLVMHKFSQKAREQMRVKQEAGSTGKKGIKREAKNFRECYEQSIHRMEDGSCGMPAGAFRAALISACRLCGFQMTKAKLAVFVEADGFDVDDAQPLVRITKGEPEPFESMVRLETGVADIRSRARFAPGWEMELRIRFDADMFTAPDIVNLLMRVGMQVGIGEGRPDSKKSAGMGWGLFTIKS